MSEDLASKISNHIVASLTPTMEAVANNIGNALVQEFFIPVAENIATNVQQAVAPITKNIIAIVLESFKEPLNYLNNLSERVNQYDEFEKKTAEELHLLLKKAGFWLPPNMRYSQDFFDLLKLDKNGGNTNDVKQFILNLFKENDYERLKEVINQWYKSEYFFKRKHIFDAAFQAHREGKYTLSIPTLVPHIEGIMGDITGLTPGYVNELILPVLKESMKEYNNDSLKVISLDLYLIAFDLLYNSKVDFANYSELLQKKYKLKETEILDRQAILHGVLLNYDNEENSLRALLLLNVLYELLPYEKQIKEKVKKR